MLAKMHKQYVSQYFRLHYDILRVLYWIFFLFMISLFNRLMIRRELINLLPLVLGITGRHSFFFSFRRRLIDEVSIRSDRI